MMWNKVYHYTDRENLNNALNQRCFKATFFIWVISFQSIFQMGTFKGKRSKSLLLSANVKPRYHRIKSIKSPYKSPAKQKIRPKENEFLIALSRATK